MVSRALLALENNIDYQNALKAIEDAERPLLEEVSNLVLNSLTPFVNGLRSVSTTVSREKRSNAMRRSAEILLDDGTLTPLSQKGDGVKSLVAIALAKASAEGAAGDRNLILAIEEPEAHLHSHAVHALRALLEDIAKTRQVIISTHEPALVRRDNIGSNVLVRNNKAKPAVDLDEVRTVLGVRLSENLVSPDLVLLVEGVNDVAILTAYIKVRDIKLTRSISSGRLRIVALHGAGNLSHQLRFFQALVCNSIVFMDNDGEALNALLKARRDGLVETNTEFCASKPGQTESELEDLIDSNIYSSELCALLGLQTLKPRRPSDGKKKWSDRLILALREGGKPESEDSRSLGKAKAKVCELAVSNGASCFLPALVGPVDNLLAALRGKLRISE
jgi:predicted ATP-dependent endonuclease of OLD family